MSKSEKSAFFRHVFANNFFLYIFSKLFQRIQNQRVILRFLHLFQFKKKKNFRSYQYIFRTLTANAQETAQKNGKSFFMNVSQNLIMQPSKGLHNQVVKIVVPQCTRKASEKLNVVLLHLWHINVKMIDKFICIILGDFKQFISHHKTITNRTIISTGHHRTKKMGCLSS